MIPKIIHYCWFGKKPLPKLALKCIESWKRFFPDYEIKEWNEDNFDVNAIAYTRESYNDGKYAFVSDYARYWILYHYGGVYFDTDVEVVKSFDKILNKGPFMGIEKNRDMVSVAPGLGMGAFPGMIFYKEVLKIYENWNPLPFGMEPLLVKQTSSTLMKHGWIQEDKLQKVCDIWIYPDDYFNPLDDYTGKINITSNTVSIHYFAKSWIEGYTPFRDKLAKFYHRILMKFRQ